MKAHLDRASPDFEHRVAEDARGWIRIKSTCKKCGASEIVSAADDSLTKWEDGHKWHSEHQSA